MTDKEIIREQANIDISNIHIAQEQGIITEFGKGKLEALEGIVDFINYLQEKTVSEDLEEAANDFCTRCFKYNKCKCAKSECVMADSYQEGYEDGYCRAEKDLELTWEDIREIIDISFEEATGLQRKPNIYKEQYYQEVLERFNEERNK